MRAGHLSELPAVITLAAGSSDSQSLGFFLVVHVTLCSQYLPNVLNSFPKSFLLYFPQCTHIQTIKGTIEINVKIPQMIVSLNDRFFRLQGPRFV